MALNVSGDQLLVKAVLSLLILRVHLIDSFVAAATIVRLSRRTAGTVFLFQSGVRAVK